MITMLLFCVTNNYAEEYKGETGMTGKIQEDFHLITIHNEGYDTHRKGPVNFYHWRHLKDYKENCWECHHDYNESKENTWAPWKATLSCDACHDPMEKDGNVVTLQAAFHLQCRTCHEEKDIYKGEVRAYNDCNKCHVQEVIIENAGYEEDLMPPVIFPHRKHEETYVDIDGERIECVKCHHEFVDGKNVLTEWDTIRSCGTTGCHDPLEKIGENQEKLRTAYHDRCKVCHRDVVKAGKSNDAPYIECSGCHHTKD